MKILLVNGSPRQHGNTDGAQTGRQVPENMSGAAMVLDVAAIGGSHVGATGTVVAGMRRCCIVHGC